MQIDDITAAVVDASITIHRELGPGLLESVYTLAASLERRSAARARAPRQLHLRRNVLRACFPRRPRRRRLRGRRGEVVGEARARAYQAAPHVSPPVESPSRPAPELRCRHDERRPEASGERSRPHDVSRTSRESVRQFAPRPPRLRVRSPALQQCLGARLVAFARPPGSTRAPAHSPRSPGSPSAPSWRCSTPRAPGGASPSAAPRSARVRPSM